MKHVLFSKGFSLLRNKLRMCINILWKLMIFKAENAHGNHEKICKVHKTCKTTAAWKIKGLKMCLNLIALCISQFLKVAVEVCRHTSFKHQSQANKVTLLSWSWSKKKCYLVIKRNEAEDNHDCLKYDKSKMPRVAHLVIVIAKFLQYTARLQQFFSSVSPWTFKV